MNARRMAWGWALALAALGGCDDGAAVDDGTFEPIGRGLDAAVDEAVSPPPPPPDGSPTLRLRFEPIEHDAGALRITDMAFLGEGGDFVVLDKDGEVIHMTLDGDGARRLGAFTVGSVWADSDAGLISVAVDPDFARNRWLYLGFTTSRTTSVIRRYTFDPVTLGYDGIAATEVEVFEVDEPRAPRSWHNIGSMGFDDTGALWALLGDKVQDDNARNLETPLGGLIRIVPLPEGGHGFPDDNPYSDGMGHPAVFAKGMRSPWKGFFHAGRWWFGDVGLDSYEEVNVIEAPGDDFGWPDYEGPCPGGGCVDAVGPRLAYGRSGSHAFVREDERATSSRLRSVWVAAPHRPGGDDPYAGRWDEVVLFGDAFVGYVRGVPVEGGESFAVGHLHFATAFAQGPDGYVYGAALGTWPVDAPVAPSPIVRAVLDD